MKKILLGFLVGVVATLLVQSAYQIWRLHQFKYRQELLLPDVVKETINRNLEGARFLDMSWSPSTAKVNFVSDKLYDVHISYERNGKIKRFTMPIGVSKKAWITPPVSELEKFDDQAEIIHLKSQKFKSRSGG